MTTPATITAPSGNHDSFDNQSEQPGNEAGRWALPAERQSQRQDQDPTTELLIRGSRLRPAKTQQKISGRLRSEKTTSYRYRIASYTSTAAKHGIGILQALRDALLGHAWMPDLATP